MRKIHIHYRGRRIKAELAQTTLEQFKGLRGRHSGKMLFRFSKAQQPSMDMIGVKDELYMYAMRELGENTATVISTDIMQPVKLRDRSTWRTYKPEKPVHYILESFDKLNLHKGHKARFKHPELDQIF